MIKKVIVVSHRRSGTHLTIDAIVNNFEKFKKSPEPSLLTLDHLSSHVKQWSLTINELRARMGTASCIFKTHAHGYIPDFFLGDKSLLLFIEDLFKEAKIIYVYRDGRDVLTSLYHYHQRFESRVKNIPFNKYIRMLNDFDGETYQEKLDRVEYWSFHVRSWMEKKNCLLVSYDEMNKEYLPTLRKISKFLEEPLVTHSRDIRRNSDGIINTVFKKAKSKILNKSGIVRSSSVSFRKGVSGDWKELFSPEDKEFFDHKAGKLNQMLGYE